MSEIIFPVTLQSSSELNALLALIKDVCAQEGLFIYRQQAVFPLSFVIHGGWLQSKQCQEGVIYRAISAKKLGHHFYSIWLPLHQACVAGDEKNYLTSRANLLSAALTDGDGGGKKAAFWGGLTRLEWNGAVFCSDENEEDNLLLSLAYQFGIQIFWSCHTAFSLQCHDYVSVSKDIGSAALLLGEPHDWVKAMLSGVNHFPELPLSFRQHILHATARDFIAVGQSMKEVGHV